MMKRILFVLTAVLLAACTTNESEEMVNGQSSMVNDTTEVTLTFSPYEQSPMSRMTRAASSITNYCTHLDVWIVNGSDVIDVHQSSGEGFGSVSVTLDKTKTYQLFAVAHKCASDATLADGVISFPDDKVTHSMFYKTTFTPSTTTSLNCVMERIVAQFRIETTDAIPDEAKKVQITINDVFDRWNVSTGGTHSLNRTSVLNIGNKNQDGSAIFNVYAIVTNAQTMHSVTVAFVDENDDVVITPRTFENVPLRNGFKTTYRGAIKDLGVGATFMVDDMQEYDVITF